VANAILGWLASHPHTASGVGYGGGWLVFKSKRNNRVFCSYFYFLNFLKIADVSADECLAKNPCFLQPPYNSSSHYFLAPSIWVHIIAIWPNLWYIAIFVVKMAMKRKKIRMSQKYHNSQNW
jgi:hypothetical protein